MRTFLQLQTEIHNQLKQDVGNDTFWTEEEVKNAINDTLTFIADEYECFKLDEIIQIVNGVRTYKLPDFYVPGSLHRVEFNNRIVAPITATEMDSFHAYWRNIQSSLITNYFPPGDICSIDEISVYPLPNFDGDTYLTATQNGVIVDVNDTDDFTQEEGIIVGTSDGESRFDETMGSGPVQEIKSTTNNLRIFGSRYPKRMVNDTDTPEAPLSYNPKRVLVTGPLAILFEKEGEGKDIQKASYYNKRYIEALVTLMRKPKTRRINTMRSISDLPWRNRYINLGDYYPLYQVK